MNPPEPSQDELSLDPLARKLLAIDEALEKTPTGAGETPLLVTGSTAHGDASQPLAEQCLEWIEAIRVTSPNMLAAAFQHVTNNDAPTLVGETATIDELDLESQAVSMGRFQLIRRIGQGGYGVVFLARDPTLQREVALKVPRPEVLVTADLKKRFLREAEAAASLDHPHIVSVFEAGSVGPVCYIASAYCPGGSLSQWLQSRGQVMSPRLAAQLVATLSGAVQHAHDRGVLHRDIKPGNVLVEQATKSGSDALVSSVRLCDFGLARVIEGSPEESISMGIVGTPAYMAPEQAANDRQRIGIATDVYGLGATLYHLLTGRPPIVGSSQIETLSAILTEDPVEPTHYRADVPRDLSAICMKALEKDLQRRYATAAELAADLQRFLQGQQVVARPVSQWQRTAKWCRRNPAVATWVGISTTAVLAALVVALVGWFSTSRALEREQAALDEADRAYVETKDAVEDYYLTISENQLLNAPGMTPLRKELLSSALDYYTRFVNRHQNDASAAKELGRAYVKIADVHEKLGDFSAALEAYEKSLRLSDSQVVDEASALEIEYGRGTILRKLARLSVRVGKRDQAMEQIDEALSIHRALIGDKFRVADNQHQIAQLLGNRAGIHQSEGEFAKAIELYEEGEQLVSGLLEQKPTDREFRLRLAQLRGNRAIAIRMLGDLNKSKQLMEASIDVYRALVADFPQVATYQSSLGKAYANLSLQATLTGDKEGGLSLLQEATEVFDRLADAHPQVAMYDVLRATTRQESAELLGGLGRLTSALDALATVIKIYERVGNRSPQPIAIDVAIARLNLGKTVFAMGDLERARPLIEEARVALEVEQQRNPRNFFASSGLGLAYDAEAQLALKSGAPADALAWFDESHDVFDSLKQIMPNNGLVIRSLAINDSRRADVFDYQREYGQAIELRRKAFAQSAPQDTHRCRLELATSLARAGQLAEAEALVAEAEQQLGDDAMLWAILARAHAILANDGSAVPTETTSESASSTETDTASERHRDRALELLLAAIDKRGVEEWTSEKLMHEDWAMLSSLPEFERLIAKVNVSND